MNIEIIEWLEEWLELNSKDSIDKFYRIEIQTIDNPGWCIIIDLKNTILSQCKFEEIKTESNANDWLSCFVREDVFYGYGDPQKLGIILNLFINWATNCASYKEINPQQ